MKFENIILKNQWRNKKLLRNSLLVNTWAEILAILRIVRHEKISFWNTNDVMRNNYVTSVILSIKSKLFLEIFANEIFQP